MKRKANLRLHSIAVICIITLFWCPTAALSALFWSIDIEVIGGQNGSSVGSVSIYPEISWDELAANPQKTYTWQMEQPLEIAAENNQDNILATVENITVAAQGDPSISLGFSVTAGQYASSFSFASPVMNFAPISNTEAYAEATISPTSGTTVWGSYPGQKPFQALYNGSTNFAYLIASPITWPVGAEMTGPTALPGSISSMQSTWQFIVSAQGMASGTSFYEIEPVPEPATIALLGMGGLFLLRRRKRK